MLRPFAGWIACIDDECFTYNPDNDRFTLVYRNYLFGVHNDYTVIGSLGRISNQQRFNFVLEPDVSNDKLDKILLLL